MMKKKMIVVLMLIGIAVSCAGCQYTAKKWGGTVNLTLNPGEKLEEITWKDDDLWYLTRPMRDGEHAETHEFNQSSDIGFEGKVIVKEQEKTER